jgi:NUDIX domain
MGMWLGGHVAIRRLEFAGPRLGRNVQTGIYVWIFFWKGGGASCDWMLCQVASTQPADHAIMSNVLPLLDAISCGKRPDPMPVITETTRIHLVLFGMQDRTLHPYLAAINSIIISLMRGCRAGIGKSSEVATPVALHFECGVLCSCEQLPAGLVDPGEAAAEAALRELREETGYTGRVEEVW